MRSVRKVIGALVRKQAIDHEVLSTLVCEGEVIVGARSLTKVSDDPRDIYMLTPNHMLIE